MLGHDDVSIQLRALKPPALWSSGSSDTTRWPMALRAAWTSGKTSVDGSRFLQSGLAHFGVNPKNWTVEGERIGPGDLPRESIPSRSRGNGLRDPVKAGLAGGFSTQQTQESSSSELPAASFAGRTETGSGAGATVSVHCAANTAGALSRKALCGRTWL